jgi:hypothetical protein
VADELLGSSNIVASIANGKEAKENSIVAEQGGRRENTAVSTQISQNNQRQDNTNEGAALPWDQVYV